MVETRRLVAEFQTPEALRDAMTRFIAEKSAEAYVLCRGRCLPDVRAAGEQDAGRFFVKFLRE